jgi:hypothetical protein
VQAEPTPPIPLRELVAANLRRLRQDAGRSAEDLIPAARAHGLDWTASWLSSVERGIRALTADQLLALPVVLSAALGHRVSLADLLVGDAPVSLGAPGELAPSSISAGYLLDVVTGHPTRRSFTQPPPPPAPDNTLAAVAARAAQRMRDIRDAGLGDVDARALARAEEGAGTAEAKLAKRLGVAPVVVAAAAASLWGHSLTEEQAALTAAGTNAATAARTVNTALSDKLRDASLAMVEARLAALAPRAADERPAGEQAAGERPTGERPAGEQAAARDSDVAVPPNATGSDFYQDSPATDSGSAPGWTAFGGPAPAW